MINKNTPIQKIPAKSGEGVQLKLGKFSHDSEAISQS